MQRQPIQARADGSDPAASALRVPDSEAAFLALHAGDGGRGLRRSAGSVSARWRRRCAAIRAASEPRAFCYAVGWTQHTVGVQYIRTAAIIQLLLGNMGRPGGGIMALRGHASIQGSTDIPTLYNLAAGLSADAEGQHDKDLRDIPQANESPSGWWGEFPSTSCRC